MGLCLGIGKRELLEDYYMDEIGSIAQAWNELHNPSANETEVISPEAFFGGGGEKIGGDGT